MKTLIGLIAVSLIMGFTGCKKQDINEKNQQILDSSGELVFGDKKVTYFMEGEG